MAFYSYKHVAHAWPHDMIERWEAAEGREFDGDYNYSGDGWLVASMWIDELIEASAKRDAEIAKLRAENARLREAMVDVAYGERCGAHEGESRRRIKRFLKEV